MLTISMLTIKNVSKQVSQICHRRKLYGYSLLYYMVFGVSSKGFKT